MSDTGRGTWGQWSLMMADCIKIPGDQCQGQTSVTVTLQLVPILMQMQLSCVTISPTTQILGVQIISEVKTSLLGLLAG